MPNTSPKNRFLPSDGGGGGPTEGRREAADKDFSQRPDRASAASPAPRRKLGCFEELDFYSARGAAPSSGGVVQLSFALDYS